MEKAALLRQGIIVIVGLTILTGIEFWAAVTKVPGGMVVLWVLALAKALVILFAYMHLGKAFRADEGGH